jgi:hypothetical protein
MPIYHFDWVNGSDANDGLSDLNPKKTPWASAWGASDALRLKRGQVFPAPTRWDITGSSQVVTDYGNDGPLPKVVNGFDSQANLDLFRLQSANNCTVENVHFMRERPFPAFNDGRAVIEMRGAGTGGHMLRGCIIDGGGDGVRVINGLTNISIVANQVFGANADAIWLEHGDNVLIHKNIIQNFGLAGAAFPNGDAVQTTASTGRIVVSCNDIVMPQVSTKQAIMLGQGLPGMVGRITGNRVHNPGSSTASILNIDGKGSIDNNICTGNIGRGIQINSTDALHNAAEIYNNIIVSALSDATYYGIVIQGAFAKDVKIYHNTMIGGFGRGVFALSDSMPPGSSYTGGNNHIDCMGAGRAFWNDSATAWESLNDNVRNVTGGAIGSVTLTGALAVDPRLSSEYRPLPGSPLIGAATLIGNKVRRDIRGLQDGRRTIGAYGVGRTINQGNLQ